MAIEQTHDYQVSQWVWNRLNCWYPIFLVECLLILQRLKRQKVLNLKGLLTADFVPDDMRLQLTSEQFTSNQELKMETLHTLFIKWGLKKLFEEFVAFGLIHFGRKINLWGINLVFGEFGGEFGDDLFGDFVVELLDFGKLVHGRKRMGQMVKFIIICVNL